jgi:hypothetical protein
MTDPVTLAAVGAVALTEGVKFLYAQAGAALERWRARRSAAEPVAAEPVEIELPAGAFEGQLRQPRLNLTAVGRLERELGELRAALAEYAQGIGEVNPGDELLLETVDGLRRAMETIYGQPITFKGEARPPSGVGVVAEAKVGEVAGYLAGLRARRIEGGTVRARLEADRVAADGEAVAVDVDTIG